MATDDAEMAPLYLNPIIQVGDKLHHYLDELNPEKRGLAMLSWSPTFNERTPEYEYSMGQFGVVSNKLGEACITAVQV